MASQRTERGGRNRAALFYICIATVGYSLVPLVIALGGGTESPFLLNAGISLGRVIGSLPFLLYAYRDVVRHRSVLAAVARRVPSWPMLFMLIMGFQFTFFAWSTRFINISVTAILFETWPILMIFLTAWLYRKASRYRESTLSMWMLLAFGFMGCAFVVLSQTAGEQALGRTDIAAMALGIVLALMGAGAASLSAFGFKWGTDLGDHLRQEHEYASSKYSLDLFGAVLASTIAPAVVFPINLIVGFAIGETLPLAAFATAAGAGIVFLAGATRT